MTNTLYRDKSRGIIAGVCAGLADYFGVSPVLLRLIFLVLAFAGGPAVAAYLILWIVLPDKATLDTSHQDAVRDNVREIGVEARSIGRELQGIFGGTGSNPSRRTLWLGGILILIGLVSLADALHLFSWFRPDMLWALALILAGVVLLRRAMHTR